MTWRTARAVVAIAAVALVAVPNAVRGQRYDEQLSAIAADLAAAAEASGAKVITVVDFTDLHGNVTELGRFLAEQLSSRLVAPAKGFKIVDRSNLKYILEEHALTASGLVNPANAKKLGAIANVDHIVIGTITPLSDSVNVSTKMIATETALVVAAARGDVARTQAIDELLRCGVAISAADPSAESPEPSVPEVAPSVTRTSDPRQSQSLSIAVRSVSAGSDGTVRLLFSITNRTSEKLGLSVDNADLMDGAGGSWRWIETTGVARYGNSNLDAGSVITLQVGFKPETEKRGRLFDAVLTFEVRTETARRKESLTFQGLRQSDA